MKRSTLPPPGAPELELPRAQRAAESLSQAIRFRTVAHESQLERGGYGEWMRLREYLRGRFPRVHQTMARETPGRFSLLYHWAAPESDKLPLLFCAHQDVVDAGGEWTHDPFEGIISDDEIWGRGTLDCKNVLICLLEAAEQLLESGFTPDRDIWFAFGHDEEIGGKDGAYSIADTFIERNLHFAMVLDEGGYIGRTALPIGRPAAHIGVAEKGMTNLRFTARSPGGHASAPPKHTALGRLSEAISRLEFRPLPPRLTPQVRDSLRVLMPYLPWRWRVILSHPRLFRASLMRGLAAHPAAAALVRTTIAPTMARAGVAPNVLPDTAEAILNMRVLHDENDAALSQYLTDLTDDLGVEIEVLMARDPSAVSKYNGRAFQSVTETVQSVFGPTPTLPSLMCGGTDARHYERFSDCVYRFMPFVLTPEQAARIHGRDERVSVDALGRAVEFYRRLMSEF